MLVTLTTAVFITLATLAFAALKLRSRGVDIWIVPYIRNAPRRYSPDGDREVHVLLAIADHFEPQHGKADPERSRERVNCWLRDYPRLFQRFRDSDGRPPQHTFFFPIDEYDADHVDRIGQLCRDGFGEIEIHHHHDHDTPAALRDRLLHFKELFRARHGVLGHDRNTGEVKYGFVHGNWALDNSGPDGCCCGVNNELDILRETGCYADFTLPSAPSRTQTRKINSIYYAVDDPQRPKSHDRGIDVGSAPRPDNSLMIIQGPLILDWNGRRGIRRMVPRIENSNIQANQPPTMKRLDLWLRAAVGVSSRPDWLFVKLHTHGAIEGNREILLGEAMERFHQGLAARAAANPRFHFHYVTAREMYNLARAAEAGSAGSPNALRDQEIVLSQN